MARKASAVKMCLQCHEIKPLTDFYPNRGWEAQNCTDIYCKECARKMVTDKESARKYMWENGRAFSDRLWQACEKKAFSALNNNAEWLSKSTSKKRKDEIKAKAEVNALFSQFNLAAFYVFNDPADGDGYIRDFDPDSMDGMIVNSEDGETMMNDGAKIYSAKWNGMYTKREVEYLDMYYQRLEEAFVLDDISMQDYSMKTARASLLADEKFRDYRSGKCSLKEYQDAQNIFDSMSKSANFAACQRKDKAGGNEQVLCKIIEDIEVNHHAQCPEISFPQDVIDMILNDFRHTDVAVK